MDAAPPRLADEHQIRRVLTDYCRGIDRLDAELISSVYHPDATDDHGTFVGRGADFADYVVPRLTTAYECTMHTLGNCTIDFAGDDVAHVETYVHAEHLRRAGDGWVIDLFGGRYVDRFERRDGRWLIADRVVVHDLDRTEAITRAYPPDKFRGGRRDRDDLSYMR